jgi:hypothetical protein
LKPRAKGEEKPGKAIAKSAGGARWLSKLFKRLRILIALAIILTPIAAAGQALSPKEKTTLEALVSLSAIKPIGEYSALNLEFDYLNQSTALAYYSTSSQLTQRWRFEATETWPVTPRIAIVAQVERDIVSSNLPLYAYNSTSVLIGPQIRF